MKVLRQQVANCGTIEQAATTNRKSNGNIDRFIGEKHTEKSMVLPSKVSEKVFQFAKNRLKRSLSSITRSDSSSSLLSSFQIQQNNVIDVFHNQIELGEILGEGAFSSVYQVKSLNGINNKNKEDITEARCVVKVLQAKLLSKPAMFSACAADLVKEGLIMASLCHKNILSVKAWAPYGLEGYRSSGRHDSFFLVIDRLDMTLSRQIRIWKKQSKSIKYSFINRKKKEKKFYGEQLHVALQLADAIQYLHSQNILHRDLKPENIGFDCDGILKVFDFDVARIMPTSSSSTTTTTTTTTVSSSSTSSRNCCHDETFLLSKRVGSPRYMSPEIALGQKYNLKADVYSFGLILHEMLSFDRPYNDINPLDHDYLVFVQDVRPNIPNSWSTCIKSLLYNAWSSDISIRPRMSEIHSILAEHTKEQQQNNC